MDVQQREQVISAVNRLQSDGISTEQISRASELWVLVSSPSNELTAESLGLFYTRLGASFPEEELERMIAALGGGGAAATFPAPAAPAAAAAAAATAAGGAMDFYAFVRAVSGHAHEFGDAFAKSLEYMRRAGAFGSAEALRGKFAELGETLAAGEAESLLQTADDVGLAAGSD